MPETAGAAPNTPAPTPAPSPAPQGGGSSGSPAAAPPSAPSPAEGSGARREAASNRPIRPIKTDDLFDDPRGSEQEQAHGVRELSREKGGSPRDERGRFAPGKDGGESLSEATANAAAKGAEQAGGAPPPVSGPFKFGDREYSSLPEAEQIFKTTNGNLRAISDRFKILTNALRSAGIDPRGVLEGKVDLREAIAAAREAQVAEQAPPQPEAPEPSLGDFYNEDDFQRALRLGPEYARQYMMHANQALTDARIEAAVERRMSQISPVLEQVEAWQGHLREQEMFRELAQRQYGDGEAVFPELRDAEITPAVEKVYRQLLERPVERVAAVAAALLARETRRRASAGSQVAPPTSPAPGTIPQAAPAEDRPPAPPEPMLSSPGREPDILRSPSYNPRRVADDLATFDGDPLHGIRPLH